jgi:hypothetical protein
MIDPSKVAVVIVTRGDVPISPLLHPFSRLGFDQYCIWDNSVDTDFAVFGRYAAIDRVHAPVALVQDDDVLLTEKAINGLLKAYKPGFVTANMPPEFRRRYKDSCLVGFGAIFDSHLPLQAFARLNGDVPEDVFNRTCDIFFTTLTPRKLVNLPFTYLPYTYDANRMYRTPGNTEERTGMLQLARRVRDA